MTPADLSALVVGAALAAALHRYFTQLGWGGLGPEAWWYGPLHVAREVFGKGCLALVPVVLARRARFGGLARPAEFLAACCGPPWLTLAVDRLPAMLVPQTLPGPPTIVMFVHSATFWRWKLGLLALAVAAAVGLAAGRRRLPGWVATALLLIAWLGLHGALPPLSQAGAERIIAALSLDGFALEVIVALIVGPPLFLLYGIPAASALGDLRRAGRPRRSWVDWAGLGLAAGLFVASETVFLATDHANVPPGQFGPIAAAFATILLASAGLSVLVVRRLGPAWSRRLAAGYNTA